MPDRSDSHLRVVLIRHAETEWSRSGRHTGRTDLDLTVEGERRARRIGKRLGDQAFDVVLTSPLRRARQTCELAGLAGQAAIRDDLAEWDYGQYEGITTEQVHARRPGWTLWTDGAPGGESPADVRRRVDRVVAHLAGLDGEVAVFSHGHLLRALGARWLGLPVALGGRFLLDTAAICVLTRYRGQRVVGAWNRGEARGGRR